MRAIFGILLIGAGGFVIWKVFTGLSGATVPENLNSSTNQTAGVQIGSTGAGGGGLKR